MGIPDFLTRVLETAGRPCDLSNYVEGVGPSKRRRRQLRLGIDVSSWIYSAAHGHGSMLADERHLSNYGRASLYDEQQRDLENPNFNPPEEVIREYVETCTKHVLTRMEFLRDKTQANILVVLDGASPPIKTREVARRRALRQEQERVREQPVDPNESPSKSNIRRTKAFRRAGAGRYHKRILQQMMKALREAQISFLVAPYEADSQLAYLSLMGYLDLVVTEDSDLVAHGAKAVLYKSLKGFSSNKASGKLLRFADIGAVVGDNWNLIDFTPVMMTILFVSVGCDYCDKLKGVGLLTAARVIREAFLSPPSKEQSRISRVLHQLYLRCYMDSKALTPAFKKEYEERFLGAIFMYRHPIVYDPLNGNDVFVSRSLLDCEYDQESLEEGEQDPLKFFVDKELQDHEPYMDLCRNQARISEIVGVLRPKARAMRSAQGLEDQDTPNDEGTTREGVESTLERQHDVPSIRQPELATQDESELLETQAGNVSIPEPQQQTQTDHIIFESQPQLGTPDDDSPLPLTQEPISHTIQIGNEGGIMHSPIESESGDEVNETFEATANEPQTQPNASPHGKPLSRQLNDDFEAMSSEKTSIEDSVK